MLQPIDALHHMIGDDITTCQDYPEEHVELIIFANRQCVWKEVD